jgi:hypothetical protein
MIAANAGVDLVPRPFRPVLRGLLLTGRQPRYLRHEITGGAGDVSAASPEPLWWPPAKIVGRYLAPFLGTVGGFESPPEARSAPGAVPVKGELEREKVDRLTASGLTALGRWARSTRSHVRRRGGPRRRRAARGRPVSAREPAVSYAVGTARAPSTAGVRFRRKASAVSGLRSAPPIASTANPIPASSRAIPTTIPNSAIRSAM